MHLGNDKTLIDETGEGEGLDDHSFDEIFEQKESDDIDNPREEAESDEVDG